MAKHRKPKPVNSTESPPTHRIRSGKALNIWIPADIRDAIDVKRRQNRRSLTAEVLIALEQYLGMGEARGADE